MGAIRTGTLWEGRFKAALVDTDRYLLTCYRYIQLNPVRAHMTDDPCAYPWSSYRLNALCGDTPLITPHGQFTRLAPTPGTRQVAYRAGSRIRRRKTSRRSSAAYPTTSCLGQRTLSAANGSLDPAVGQRQAAWQTTKNPKRSGHKLGPFFPVFNFLRPGFAGHPVISAICRSYNWPSAAISEECHGHVSARRNSRGHRTADGSGQHGVRFFDHLWLSGHLCSNACGSRETGGRASRGGSSRRVSSCSG